MSDFPKWLLALAGINLLPLIVCPLFLFGDFHPFGTSDIGIANFLLYLLTNLLWVIPALIFFGSLELYRRCYELPAIVLAVLGVLLTVGDFILLLMA